MSTGLLATPNLAGRSVALKVTDLPAGYALAINRTDANGTRTVRLPRDAAPDANGGYTVTDHEAALTGALTYKVVGTRTNEIANPYFTTDLAGWSFGGTGATMTRDTSIYRSSPASLKFATQNAGSDLRYTFAVPAHLRNASTRVYVHGYARGTGTYQVTARGYDGTGASTGDISSATIALDSTFQRLYVELLGLAPTTETVRAIFWQHSAGVQTLYLDDVLAEINGPTGGRGVFTGTYTNQVITATTSLVDATRANVWVHAAAYPSTLPHVSGGIVTDWRPTRDTGAQLVDVLGRADAIDTGPALARTRSHTVEVRHDTLTAARQLEDVVAAARTVVLRQNTVAGLDTTLTVETIEGPHPDPSNPRRWRVVLRGREALAGPYLEDPP